MQVGGVQWAAGVTVLDQDAELLWDPWGGEGQQGARIPNRGKSLCSFAEAQRRGSLWLVCEG